VLHRLASELRAAEPALLGVVTGAELAATVAGEAGDEEREAAEPARRWPDSSRLEHAVERLRGEPDLERLRAGLIADDGDSARVMLLVPLAGFERLELLFDRCRERAARATGSGAWITGAFPLVLAAQRSLLKTLLVSATLSALAIGLILRGLLGSSRAALAALVPNLWPVLVVLGAMGWAGVPIDSTTVMIAAVALGLSVDDTLHVLGWFRRSAGRRGAPAAAVASVARSAPALILTTALLAGGFAVCGLSSLLPVARFGALTALALVAALAADLVLRPALLAALPPAAADRLGDPLRPAGSPRSCAGAG
jgi:hypothetical protein